MTARLHHERVAHSDAQRWLVMLHGILGTGGNWRSIARAVTDRRPEWGVVLVDLRQHGRSESGEPPHDLIACAGDVVALVEEIGGVDAIAGHSFGGKVALAARGQARPGLAQTWMFDASPSARPARATDSSEVVAQLLAAMERLPTTWERREDFVQAIVAAGHPRPLAQWLAMNFVPSEAGFTLRLDIAAIRAMLADFYTRALWSVLVDPTLPGSVEVVIASQSPIVTDDDRSRLASAPPHVHVHAVDAGHWLHVDAASAVIDLLARRLQTVGARLSQAGQA